MNLVLIIAGTSLILVGLLDVFFTVLQYNYFGFLSRRLYGAVWSLVRRMVAPLPRGLRAFGLSIGAPLMIVVTLAVWVGFMYLGFALLYFAGLDREHFHFATGTEPSFRTALYLSGVTLSTLGYGDVTPSGFPYQQLAFGEALAGFGILTLTISYVLNIYGVLQRLSVLTTTLYHQATDPGDPRTILTRYFPDGEPRNLDPHLMSLHQGFVAYYEGLRRFPIVYYFHSRRPYRSMPYAFNMAGGQAAALRWGLPKGHPASKEPWLGTLTQGLTAITDRIDHRFLRRRLEAPPEPASFDDFAACVQTGAVPADAWLASFLAQESWMSNLARPDSSSDPRELYARYKAWLPFVHRIATFVRATAEDLGYDPAELARAPGARLF